jgi:hypothetical protein
MWCMLALLALGALGEIAVRGNFVGSIRDAYPGDLARRDALHRCGEMANAFSRLSEQDRDACYRALLPASARSSANQVEDW